MGVNKRCKDAGSIRPTHRQQSLAPGCSLCEEDLRSKVDQQKAAAQGQRGLITTSRDKLKLRSPRNEWAREKDEVREDDSGVSSPEACSPRRRWRRPRCSRRPPPPCGSESSPSPAPSPGPPAGAETQEQLLSLLLRTTSDFWDSPPLNHFYILFKPLNVQLIFHTF